MKRLILLSVLCAVAFGAFTGYQHYSSKDPSAEVCADVRRMITQVGDELAAGHVAQAERSGRAWAKALGPKMRATNDLEIGAASFTLESISAGLRGPDGRAYTQKFFMALTSGMVAACKQH